METVIFRRDQRELARALGNNLSRGCLDLRADSSNQSDRGRKLTNAGNTGTVMDELKLETAGLVFVGAGAKCALWPNSATARSMAISGSATMVHSRGTTDSYAKPR